MAKSKAQIDAKPKINQEDFKCDLKLISFLLMKITAVLTIKNNIVVKPIYAQDSQLFDSQPKNGLMAIIGPWCATKNEFTVECKSKKQAGLFKRTECESTSIIIT